MPQDIVNRLLWVVDKQDVCFLHGYFEPAQQASGRVTPPGPAVVHASKLVRESLRMSMEADGGSAPGLLLSPLL